MLSTGDKAGDKKVTQRGRFMDVQAPYLLVSHHAGRIAGRIERPFIDIAFRLCPLKTSLRATDPMGQTIKIHNTMSVKVAGVYEDLPANSNFGNVHFIAAWKLLLSSDEPDIKPTFKTVVGVGMLSKSSIQLADNAHADQASTLIRNSTYASPERRSGNRKPPITLIVFHATDEPLAFILRNTGMRCFHQWGHPVRHGCSG